MLPHVWFAGRAGTGRNGWCISIVVSRILLEIPHGGGCHVWRIRLQWVDQGPFNGAVDLFIIETFIVEASIAGDPGTSSPAVNVAVLWVRWVREEIHRGLGDTFSGVRVGPW